MNAQASTTGWQLEALKHESFKHFVETHQLAGEAQLIACHPKGDSHRLPAAGKVRRPSHSRLQKAPRIMAGPLAANRQKGRILQALTPQKGLAAWAAKKMVLLYNASRSITRLPTATGAWRCKSRSYNILIWKTYARK